jgi:hypothetical protein
LRDEEIDHMRAAPIDDRRDGLAVDIVEPSAEQHETLCGQVHDRRRDIDLAVEPRFHRMLVAGAHVGEVVGQRDGGLFLRRVVAATYQFAQYCVPQYDELSDGHLTASWADGS